MLEKELVNLGLSNKEAKVYLAAIQLGPAPVQKISNKSKVNRATTYVVIESLMEMGLMSTYDEEKKTFYVAEKPDRLLDFFKEKEKDLHNKVGDLKEILPEMMSLYSDFSDKPKVKYYEGIKGLISVHDDFTNTIKQKGTIYTFLPYDDFYGSKLTETIAKSRKKRLSKKIKMKIIYTSKDGRQREYEAEGKQYLKELAFVKYDKYPIHGGMNIYGNKIFMIDYKGKLGGVVIENKTLAEMMKSVFLMCWESSKK